LRGFFHAPAHLPASTIQKGKALASDQVVTTKDVLDALMKVRRQGNDRLLRELEAREPDLAEFLLEETSAVHQMVLELGAKPRQSRRIFLRVETMALVLVTAISNATLRLWREDAAGTSLADIDPSLNEEGSRHEDGSRQEGLDPESDERT
jgi:hypothetical protein